MSLSDIVAPLPFVPLISLLVHDLTVPMLLTLLKVALVHSPIGLRLLAFPCDLAILELALISRPISHEQHSLTMLHSPLVVSLVLEERVVVGVHTLTLTQLSHWVQVTNVTLKNKTVKSQMEVHLWR